MGSTGDISNSEKHLNSGNPAGNIGLRSSRLAEISTVVKVFPVILRNEDDDGQKLYFNEEKRKLLNLSNQPNPHIIKIYTVELAENGAPFIESEDFHGETLRDLLKKAVGGILKLDEVLKIARQMAGALAHSHEAGVIHGSVNSMNVKCNFDTGNYVLTDFGFSLIPPVQRLTFRQLLSSEYMAPEQQQGNLFFQTDIYSYGIVLFQILSGEVPPSFVHNTIPEHQQTPDEKFILQEILNRRKAKNQVADNAAELQLPAWLIGLIAKCLNQDFKNRFADGSALYNYILEHTDKRAVVVPDEVLEEKNREINRLKALIIQKDGQLDVFKYQSAEFSPRANSVTLSKTVLGMLLLALAALTALASYYMFFKEPPEPRSGAAYNTPALDSSAYAGNDSLAAGVHSKPVIPPLPAVAMDDDTTGKEENEAPSAGLTTPATTAERQAKKSPGRNDTRPVINQDTENEEPQPDAKEKYTVAEPKAYFYSQPDESTRRNIFMVDTNNTELTPVDESNGFIYVVFFNTDGEITRGWLRKKDLQRIN